MDRRQFNTEVNSEENSKNTGENLKNDNEDAEATEIKFSLKGIVSLKERKEKLRSFIGNLVQNPKEAQEFRIRTHKKKKSNDNLSSLVSPRVSAAAIVNPKERQEKAKVARE